MASLDHLANSELNSQRIQRVEKCFGTSGIPLSLPGRVLLGEGILTKICRKKPKARKFFLFNDVLVYGSILIDKTKYTNQRIIPLEEVGIEEENDLKYKNAWIILAKKKSFIMLANTPREKEEWMLHIAAAIKELKRKQQSALGGPLSAAEPTSKPTAAMFVPDHEALECMLCKKTRFTTFNRRHHCRNCGIVVCSECSKYFVNIPGRDQGRERVCYKCNREITDKYGDQAEQHISSSNGNLNHINTGLKNGDSSMMPTMQEVNGSGAKDGFQSDAFSDDDSDDDETPSSASIHAAAVASAAAHDQSSESGSKFIQ